MFKNKEVKQRSYLIVTLILGAMVLFVLAYVFLIGGQQEQEPLKIHRASLPSDNVDPTSIALMALQSNNKLLEGRLNTIEEVLENVQQSNEGLEEENKILKLDLHQIKVEKRKDKKLETPLYSSEPERIEPYPFSQKGSISEVPISSPRLGLTRAVTRCQRDNPFAHAEDMCEVIPSGTTLRCLLESAVEAPCGVYANSDPYPVKLRVLDDGHLPKNSSVSLKGAYIIGSAYGKRSEERVLIRAERIMFPVEQDKFVETEVTAFVTGEDGVYGLRGFLKNNATKVIKNAAITSVLSTVGDIFQAWASSRSNQYGFSPYGPNGQTNQFCSPGDIAIEGGCRGACDSFDRLTDYYIKKAEEINEVILINPGRCVDVTLQRSAKIGSMRAKEDIEEVRTTTRESKTMSYGKLLRGG
ncbi:TraB/VirB10 family protein [Chlamydiales bacterium]|nr:TraB/VirB10 family protein [Chlamydiales bacterium]